jgi:hypothetical protein
LLYIGKEAALAEFTPRLGQVLGIQDLTVDETGTLDLVFEDTLAVQILELVDSAELVFRANLGSVPDSSDRMKVYETLLQANYRWAVTAGGHLGLDLDSPTVELIRRQTTTGLQYEKFEDDLDDFVQCAKKWLSRPLRRGSPVPAEESPRLRLKASFPS